MAREMEEFRALQSEEKKVFLVNLESMERSLKDKDRELAEVSGRRRSLFLVLCFVSATCCCCVFCRSVCVCVRAQHVELATLSNSLAYRLPLKR